MIVERIRTALIDKDQAESLQRDASIAQIVSTAAIVASLGVAVFALFAAVNFPILGGILFVGSLGVALVSREINVLSGNMLTLLNDPIKKAASLLSKEKLLDNLIENTWIAKNFLRHFLVTVLN